MAKITYKPGRDDPDETEWMGIEFKAGKAVDLDKDTDLTETESSHLVAKAKQNAWFEVTGLPGRPAKADTE